MKKHAPLRAPPRGRPAKNAAMNTEKAAALGPTEKKAATGVGAPW